MTQIKKMFSMLLVLSLLFAFSSSVYAMGEQTQGKASTAKSSKINLNTAGADELVKLPRVGDKTAQRIIEYRQQNGKFKRIEDIMKIKGIGEKTFKKMEDMITV